MQLLAGASEGLQHPYGGGGGSGVMFGMPPDFRGSLVNQNGDKASLFLCLCYLHGI